uniref:Uncharacterized protein n=1 Tax=Lepeophtheirus salmonis TaxID=72036 RepID=A0A0K2U9E0_LEPSM
MISSLYMWTQDVRKGTQMFERE